MKFKNCFDTSIKRYNLYEFHSRKYFTYRFFFFYYPTNKNKTKLRKTFGIRVYGVSFFQCLQHMRHLLLYHILSGCLLLLLLWHILFLFSVKHFTILNQKSTFKTVLSNSAYLKYNYIVVIHLRFLWWRPQ